MDFEQLKMGITMLMDEIEESPHDRLELQEQLREKLAELRGFGLPVPQDLLAFEAQLDKVDGPDEWQNSSSTKSHPV